MSSDSGSIRGLESPGVDAGVAYRVAHQNSRSDTDKAKFTSRVEFCSYLAGGDYERSRAAGDLLAHHTEKTALFANHGRHGSRPHFPLTRSLIATCGIHIEPLRT